MRRRLRRSVAGFIYESQCWVLEAVFGLEEQDLGLSVRMRLKGIGDFGF